MATHETDIDPNLTERQIKKARTLGAQRLTEAVKREAEIGLGEGNKATSQEVTALKNFLGRYIPQKTDTQVTDNREPPKKEDLVANLLAIMNASPEVAQEIKKAMDKEPDLKVINGDA